MSIKRGTISAVAIAIAVLVPGGAADASAAGRLSATVSERVCATAGPGYASCASQILVDSSTGEPARPQLGTSTPAPRISPAYLQQAYDLTALSQTAGSGDTVAVVDAYDDPTAEADLTTYRARWNLPVCTTANGCFRKVAQDGTSNYPIADTGWSIEISLDLDAVSALCPNCHIRLVEATSNSFSDLAVAQAEAASLGAKQISDSWGGTISYDPGGVYTFPGAATVAASGDYGYANTPDPAHQNTLEEQYPAAFPDVNAAGGTALTAGTSPRGFSETAWSGAGSGCDTLITQPAWQSGVACTGRAYADISADADPSTGLNTYDSGSGGWLQIGGTSLATPLIAAYYAVTGADASSPAWEYANAALLNDPSSGSNGTCASTLLFICNAGAGYDGPTGVGSISGAVAVGAPGIAGPGVFGSYTQSVTASSAVLAGDIYPNSGDTSYHWEYGVTTGYGEQSTPIDIGADTGIVAVTDNLTDLQPNSTYHYRLVAENASGTIYGYDFTFTLAATPPTVTSDPVGASTTTTATLTGTVNARNLPTTYYFSYGLTIAYGMDTPVQDTAGTTDIVAREDTSGLLPGTTYHYSLIGDSSAGFSSAPDQTFTTAPAAPEVTITTAPPLSSTSTFADVTYITNGGPISTIACTLDGAGVACGTESAVLSSLGVGVHTFVVTVSGPGGSRSATANFTVTATTVVVAPPTVVVTPTAVKPAANPNRGAPTVRFTAVPSSSSSATTAKFRFAVTGASTTTTCKLNNAPVICADDSATFVNLRAGTYTLVILVTGPEKSVRATYRFTVTKKNAQTVTITSKPAPISGSTTIVVRFTTTGAITTRTCELDGVAKLCSHGSVRFTDLRVGAHKFVVVVRGHGGSASATYTFVTVRSSVRSALASFGLVGFVPTGADALANRGTQR